MNPKQLIWAIKVLKEAYYAKTFSGFPASAITAQAILETGWGKSIPTDTNSGKVSNNILGIKCTIVNGMIIKTGDDGYVKCLTHEWNAEDGYYPEYACFRAYLDYTSCILDYVNLIQTSKRYSKAMDYLNDPERYIIELWKAGYATDIKYTDKIIGLIRQVNKIPIWLLKL